MVRSVEQSILWHSLGNGISEEYVYDVTVVLEAAAAAECAAGTLLQQQQLEVVGVGQQSVRCVMK